MIACMKIKFGILYKICFKISNYKILRRGENLSLYRTDNILQHLQDYEEWRKVWPQLNVMATWKGSRMQKSERTSVLREAYISLLLRFKDRSSAFVHKGSVKRARQAHVSVHLHSPCRSFSFGQGAWQITSVKRGMDVFAFTVVFHGVTKITD